MYVIKVLAPETGPGSFYYTGRREFHSIAGGFEYLWYSPFRDDALKMQTLQEAMSLRTELVRDMPKASFTIWRIPEREF